MNKLTDSAKAVALSALRFQLDKHQYDLCMIREDCTEYWNQADKNDPRTLRAFNGLNNTLNDLRHTKAKIKKLENAIKEIKKL